MSQKSTAVKVFGILNIVFGAFGLVTAPFNIATLSNTLELIGAQGFLRQWMQFSVFIAPVTSLILLILGIGLLRYKEWGRRGTVIYSWVVIVLGVISSIFTLTALISQLDPSNPAIIGGVIGGIIGGVLGLLYPILSIVFLTRPSAKEACR